MTEWNDDGKMQGSTDVPLNKKGIIQARLLAKRMANFPLSAVFTSPLQRARETAKIIAEPHKLEVIELPELQEAGFGAWEGLTIEEIKNGWCNALELWYEGKSTPPGGENLLDMQRRVVNALERILENNKGKEVAIVSHGGPIRAFLCHILGTLKPYRRIKQANANLNILDFYEEWGWQIVSLNDISHLEQELQSELETGY